MEVKVQKQIIDLFSFFDEFQSTVNINLNDCQKRAASINTLIKRCRSIKQADVTETPLAQFEGLQSKLCAAIHNLISEDAIEIRNKLCILEEAFEKLCNKNKVLRDSCRENNFDENSVLVKGTPFQPPLTQLLEFADDTITFGSQVCAQIELALNVLSFKELDTEYFGDNFQFPKEWHRRIPKILTYTAFLSDNEI